MTAQPLIKSRYSDPAIDGRGFVNHIHHCLKDMGVLPGTTTPLTEAYKIEFIQNLQATSGGGSKPRNLALFRKTIADDPSAGVWHLIHMWKEGADYDDAHSAGSVDVDAITGDVHVVMSFGKKLPSGALQFQPWEATVRRTTFAPAIERLPGTTTDSALEARIAALEARPIGVGPLLSGGMQLLLAPRTSPAWENRTLTGGIEVDVPAVFGVPSASAYRIRFVALAAKADIRIRAGTRAAPYFVTMNTQVPNLQDHTTGDTPGPLVWVSVVDSAGTAATARVHLQICGYAV